jgi:hypothetical protein
MLSVLVLDKSNTECQVHDTRNDGYPVHRIKEIKEKIEIDPFYLQKEHLKSFRRFLV